MSSETCDHLRSDTSDTAPAYGSTIFAAASGYGRAAIAVIRLSGPGSRAALEALTRAAVPPPRRAVLRPLRDLATGETLDQALVLWLPAPASFTGEDQVELHIHGSVAVRAAVLRALSDMPTLRPAEPGEFTRRAFLAGRMDLAEVEGLADLIDAETEAQRRQALRQLEGALSGRVSAWRDRLADSLALAEAALDFSDEADVSARATGEAAALAATVRQEIELDLAQASRGERLRVGFTVVIAGRPNAGKSTLLNALARRDVAIVSPYPGTTRDAIEVRCDFGGLPVTFVDTAGLRDASDPVEQEGVSRSRSRAASADLVLWLEPPDGDDPSVAPPGTSAELFCVRSKSDLAAENPDGIAVSARTGQGLDRLVATIRARAEAAMGGAGDAVVTRERHRRALTDVVEALRRAETVWASGQDELAAEDLRLGLRALGRITGQVDVEDILDRVFAQFCIGK